MSLLIAQERRPIDRMPTNPGPKPRPPPPAYSARFVRRRLTLGALDLRLSPDALRVRMQGAAMNAGLLHYCPIEAPSAADWELGHRTATWDFLGDLSESPRYSLIAGYIRSLGPARSILDVGCGHGVLLEHLADVGFTHYVGVDISATAVARAKRLERPDGRVRFMVGNVIPTPPQRFQFVVCNEILYYLRQPAGRLLEIHDLTEPRGYLVTSVWRHRGHIALARLVKRYFQRVESVQITAQSPRGKTRTEVACWRPRA